VKATPPSTTAAPTKPCSRASAQSGASRPGVETRKMGKLAVMRQH